MKKLAGSLNRTWLAVIGLILVAAGVLWILVAAGVFASVGTGLQSSARPLSGSSSTLEQGWLPAALIVAGVIVIVFALWWLVKQLPRTDKASTMQFQKDARTGVTVMDPAILADALTTHVEELTYVTSAKAVLRGQRDETDIVFQVVVNERGDIPHVAQAVADEVVPAAATVLGRPLKDIGLIFDVTRQSRSKREVQID